VVVVQHAGFAAAFDRHRSQFFAATCSCDHSAQQSRQLRAASTGDVTKTAVTQTSTAVENQDRMLDAAVARQ